MELYDRIEINTSLKNIPAKQNIDHYHKPLKQLLNSLY